MGMNWLLAVVLFEVLPLALSAICFLMLDDRTTTILFEEDPVDEDPLGLDSPRAEEASVLERADLRAITSNKPSSLRKIPRHTLQRRQGSQTACFDGKQ